MTHSEPVPNRPRVLAAILAAGWLALAFAGSTVAQEALNGDLDRSGGIDAVDQVILQNYLAGNLNAIPGQAGQVILVDPLVGNLRLIPARSFTQGSPVGEPCLYPEDPQFTHTLTRSLAVMETEVTRTMWLFLQVLQPGLPADPSDPSVSPFPTSPVQNCTWEEAVLFANFLSRAYGLRACYYSDAGLNWPIDEGDYTTGPFYCDWDAAGYRLLSEGEWEYCCRAGTTTPFWIAEPSYSSENCYSCSVGVLPNLESAAVFCANDPDGTAAVATKLPNPWGLYDTHGNVYEWCWDRYGTYPAGSTDYAGPETGSCRVVRGGSWGDNARGCRSAFRNGSTPGDRYYYLGYRRAARPATVHSSGTNRPGPLRCRRAGGAAGGPRRSQERLAGVQAGPGGPAADTGTRGIQGRFFGFFPAPRRRRGENGWADGQAIRPRAPSGREKWNETIPMRIAYPAAAADPAGSGLAAG